MSRILLVGYHPAPFVQHAKTEAAHQRTWQFLQPLLDDGHDVCLCAGARNEVVTPVVPSGPWAERLIYRTIAFGRRGWSAALQRAHDAFRPDCVVAVNFSHCLYATRLRTDRPIWMDVYGDQLTIVQAAAYRARVERGLLNSIAFMRQVLTAGDAFSGCGTPQRHALVGELAMCGRLNRHTFGFELAHAILPGAAAPPDGEPPDDPSRALLRAQGLGEDDFVVLWCGGYNTWTDVDTLFRGLEWAMSQQPRIRFASVGASTYAGADDVYERLLGLIARSSRRSSYLMLGWRPRADADRLSREADLGVNIDAMHYETVYGTRTRLVEMALAGLPVVTSTGTELSRLLRERGAALTFEPGDGEGLGRRILRLATDSVLCRQVAEAARACVRGELSFGATTMPLRTWVRRPALAPDHEAGNRPSRLRLAEHRLRHVVRQSLWRAAGIDQ